jgi:DNA-binding response OmpR family regulator
VEPQPLRLLLVADDSHAAGLARSVRDWGHYVRHVEDGGTALAVAGQECPDVVLLDLALTDTDGYAVCERLSMTCGDPRPVIIVLTGRGLDRLRATRSGILLQITKPVDLTLLRGLLGRFRDAVHPDGPSTGCRP